MEPQNAIYDARELGTPRMMILGVQHLFAMFGATVLVPLLTGLDVSVTLLFAGIGTLIFHFISKWNVPAFLGSSFAFLGGYASVKEMGMGQGLSETLYGRTYQVVRSKEDTAVLPTSSYRPYRYRHRTGSFWFGHH